MLLAQWHWAFAGGILPCQRMAPLAACSLPREQRDPIVSLLFCWFMVDPMRLIGGVPALLAACPNNTAPLIPARSTCWGPRRCLFCARQPQCCASPAPSPPIWPAISHQLANGTMASADEFGGWHTDWGSLSNAVERFVSWWIFASPSQFRLRCYMEKMSRLQDTYFNFILGPVVFRLLLAVSGG